MSARFYGLLRRALFALDPERAHRLALVAARLGEAVARRGPGALRASVASRRLEQTLFGLHFPNPIGLAAGFDKDGIAPHLWPLLGFGFAEIGTVTALAQPGNPPPRLFRLEEDRALVNRLGFNSAGATAVAVGLRRRLRRRPPIPIGVNVGCSRAAVGDVGRELDDYRFSVRHLASLADYLAVNVSSPNTPGLRDLQAPERLARLVRAVCDEMARCGAVRPLLVKLAPDLAEASVGEVARAALEAGAAGFIAGNTTLGREGVRSRFAAEVGGLSGAPLRRRATALVVALRAAVGAGVPIVGVGGVMAVEDVCEKLEAGADLVALYTALVFEGPLVAARLARALDRELARRSTSLAAERPAARGRSAR